MYIDEREKTSNIDKKLSETIENILSKIPKAKSNDYTIKTNKNNDLIITYRKNLTGEKYSVTDAIGMTFFWCFFITPFVTFITTHLFYLSPIFLFGLICLLAHFDRDDSDYKNEFNKKIFISLMICSLLITTSLTYNRMNKLYEENADMKKEQLTKVHENIPKWIYKL